MNTTASYYRLLVQDNCKRRLLALLPRTTSATIIVDQYYGPLQETATTTTMTMTMPIAILVIDDLIRPIDYRLLTTYCCLLTYC